MRLPLAGAKAVRFWAGRRAQVWGPVSVWGGALAACEEGSPLVPTLLGHVVACSCCRRV